MTWWLRISTMMESWTWLYPITEAAPWVFFLGNGSGNIVLAAAPYPVGANLSRQNRRRTILIRDGNYPGSCRSELYIEHRLRTISLNKGDGTFGTASRIFLAVGTGTGAGYIVSGDFNRDGYLDPGGGGLHQ